MTVNTSVPARFWHLESDGRIQCDLCPRECKLQPGQRGLCFVRMRDENQLVLTTWGRSSGFAVDPIEKKPLNHFLPGSSVLSFGTAGCNLSCRFCQNWDISKSRSDDRSAVEAPPDAIAAAAVRASCESVAFTYNDPVIFAEYAIDVARACHDRGVRTVAVTAGYVNPPARAEFFAGMDAANVDLKAFTQEFYHQYTASNIEPVKETLRYLVHETNVWTEITTLLIPELNDSDDEIARLSDWVVTTLGPDVPLHFSAFHPDHRMTDTPRTPASTLTRARERARSVGIRHVYTGNVHDERGGTTECPACKTVLIVRDWFEILRWNLSEQGACPRCHTRLAGHFAPKPGTFGRKRLRVTV